MDLQKLDKHNEYEWRVSPQGNMRVPAVIYGSEELLADMDEKVFEQITNVASLPGIVQAAYAMPDAHWGYGFPIGGVAAFDSQSGGVISAGGVGFDISCGVRTLHTGLGVEEIEAVKTRLADLLFQTIPAGMGSRGKLRLNPHQMDEMLSQGARWAVAQGYGEPEDLSYIEENGCMLGADPSQVSDHAKKRQRDEMGTLGSGNHYLELQKVVDIYDQRIAEIYGLRVGDVKVTIHCGSRGLGHQIGTEYLKKMTLAAGAHGLDLPDRELACAPLNSALGRCYLGAMRAAINCALANREILTHLTRQAFAEFFPGIKLELLYDVSHNTCKEESHPIGGQSKTVFVHRKGATRAFGPGYAGLPERLRAAGQPVLIGGTMGTESYILAGSDQSMAGAFGSACHGAGRAMSRRQAKKRWHGHEVQGDLAARGILIRSPSPRGVAEEAPGAYKNVSAVVEATESAGLARRVARLEPMICIKG
jgi:tRNA-splicing ligase RtcB